MRQPRKQFFFSNQIEAQDGFTTGLFYFFIQIDEALMIVQRRDCRAVSWTVFKTDQIMGGRQFSFLFWFSCFLKKWIFIKRLKHSLWRCVGDVDEEAGHGTAGHTNVVAGHGGELRFDFWALRHNSTVGVVIRNLVYDRIHNGYE